MSFQDLQNGKRTTSSSPSSSKSPSQEVAAGIFQINTAVSAFRRLVDSIGTSKDTPQHRQKLQTARQRILQLVKETSAKLKSISDSDRNSNVHQSKKIEDAKLVKDFQNTLQEFQKVQQLASERESTFSPSQPPPPPSAVSGSADYEPPSGGTVRDQERHPFLMEQKRQELLLLDNEISFNEAIVDERDQGIREIEEQISHANEMFKDLAVLVHDQGITIDDIHSNIESSSAATTQAKVQLAKASKSVKSRCSWCWWLLGVAAVAVIIFLIIIIV